MQIKVSYMKHCFILQPFKLPFEQIYVAVLTHAGLCIISIKYASN